MKVLIAGGSGYIGRRLSTRLVNDGHDVALGAESQLLLDGRRAVAEKAQGAGYRFKFGGLPQALEDALRSH